MSLFFSTEFLDAEYALVRSGAAEARSVSRLADLRSECTKTLEAGGHVLHVFFVSGDFPKSCTDVHREALLELSDALKTLHAAVMKKEAAE